MKKVDLKKPYGLINGDPEARYEQDGLLFNWQGHLIGDNTPDEPEDEIKTNNEPKINDENEENLLKSEEKTDAEQFLLRILKENPLAKSVIFDLSEKEKLNWSEVKDAFISLNIQEYQIKKIWNWKLPENLMPNNA